MNLNIKRKLEILASKLKHVFTKDRIFSKYLLYAIFFLIFVVCAILDATKIVNVCFNELSLSIITIIIPTLLTVVTISLSLISNKVYGLDRSKLKALRGKYYIGILEIVFISISIVGLLSISSVFSLNSSLLCLDVISILFCFVVAHQEINILVLNEKHIAKIVRQALFDRSGKVKDSFSDDTVNSEITNYITNQVLTKGFSATYNCLFKNKKTKNLYEEIIYRQNDYFKKLYSEIDYIKELHILQFGDINIDAAVIKAYENIGIMLETKELNIYSHINSRHANRYLSNLYFYLHYICVNLKLEKIEDRHIQGSMFTMLYSSILKKNSLNMQSLFVEIACASVKNEEVWFLDFFKKFEQLSSLFGVDNYLGVFFYIMAVYLDTKNTQISKEFKNKIHSFIYDRITISYFGMTSINDFARNYYNNASFSTLCKSISELLAIYDSLEPLYFQFVPSHVNSYSIDENTTFLKDFIIDYCVETIIFGLSNIDYKQESLTSILDSLGKNKTLVARRLGEAWLKEGKIINKNRFFGTLCDADTYSDHSLIDENIENEFEKFRSTFFKTRDSSLFGVSDVDFENEKKKIIKEFDSSIQQMFFFKNISLEQDYKELYSFIRISSEGASFLIDSYAKQFAPSATALLMNEIKRADINRYETDSFQLDENVIKQIIEFHPTHCTTSMIRYLEEGKKLDIKFTNCSGLKRDLFWKEGAFWFCASIDNKGTIVRWINEKEANEIVEKEYSPINGYYRYSAYGNTESEGYLLSRNELITTLMKTYMIVVIHIKYKTIIHPKNILLIEQKRTNK